MKLKNDKYRKVRGGYSRLLEIKCSSCDKFLFRYQKDGPGIIKRIYLDRIFISSKGEEKLLCPNCKKAIGYFEIYKKEKRPAYTIFPGMIKRKIIKLR